MSAKKRSKFYSIGRKSRRRVLDGGGVTSLIVVKVTAVVARRGEEGVCDFWSSDLWIIPLS